MDPQLRQRLLGACVLVALAVLLVPLLLDGGCLRCTVRSDLVETLRSLAIRRARGEIEFDRVVIETTGLADPAPVVHAFIMDPMAAARFRLDGVIATVDAVNGLAQLGSHFESVKQAAMADRIVLTKGDLADPGMVARLRARLGELNPAATIHPARMGEIGVSRAPLPWLTNYGDRIRSIFGDDYLPYGIEPNRTTLQAFVDWSYEQGVCHRRVSVEELFAESTFTVHKV